MVAILNKVPYECRIKARDLASGKSVSNILYYRCNETGFGYASPVTGSDLATFEGGLYHKWFDTVNPVMDLLNENYSLLGLDIRSMIGRGYPNVQVPIVGVVPTPTSTQITTLANHGLTTGNSVFIQGFTTPAALNGVHNSVVVTSPTVFEVPGAISGPYTGPGTAQKVSGQMGWLYGDRLFVAHDDAATHAADMMPLYVTVSMRRLNTGLGKSFRSRISLSPISEDQQVNGRLEAADLTAFNLAGTSLLATITGGTANMMPVAVSKKIAFTQDSPFTESDSWAKPVTGYAAQPDLGSIVKRKPRLTAAIV